MFHFRKSANKKATLVKLYGMSLLLAVKVYIYGYKEWKL